MTWHPILADADPSDAWFTPSQLAEFRRAEEIDRAIERRDAFEAAVADLTNPSPEEVRDLWDRIDKETQP